MTFKNNQSIFIKRILPFLLFFLVFSGTKFTGADDDIYAKINRDMDIFGRVYKEIALNYVDEIDPDKFIKAGIEGMLNTLDPYTNFLDETRKDEVDLLTTGKYGGVGITISLRDSMIVITDVLDGYSAQREGIKPGDIILEIDGNSLIGRPVGDVRAYVRGTPGSQLKMKVRRSGKELDFVLTRQEIKLKNVTYKGFIEDGIGYIRLERFNKNSESELTEALSEFKAKGPLKGIVLDMRDNPGGLLDAAIGILNKFVDRNSLLLTTKGRKPDSERKYFSTEDPMIPKDVPLVVIVNGNTASASEIVAGAIQDLDRGVIVGTKSFGKGLVQVFTPLSYDTQLKITNQKYFTPSGRWIQAKNYFKENKFGVFLPNPYFNQSEFKTLGGRTVLPEGGISPDTVVISPEGNELLDELRNQDMYYRFAEKYIYEHPGMSSVSVTDEIVNEFNTYLNSQSFEYTSKAETKTAEIKNIISGKNYSDKVKSAIDELENELKIERLRDFERSKSQVKRQLEIELLRKINRSEQEITNSGFAYDIQLQTAVELIKNSSLYKHFLNQ